MQVKNYKIKANCNDDENKNFNRKSNGEKILINFLSSLPPSSGASGNFMGSTVVGAVVAGGIAVVFGTLLLLGRPTSLV